MGAGRARRTVIIIPQMTHSTNTEARVIEARELEEMLPRDDLLVVDVGSGENYLRGHIPGAVHLDYNGLILGQPPAPGLMPPLDQLQWVVQSIGLTAGKRVIAYDDQGNGRASRLLWTLEAVGHKRSALLNGGLPAWYNEGHPLGCAPNRAEPSDFSVELNPAVIADKQRVLAAINDPRITLLDARTPEEYSGTSVKSPIQRPGHIPGAVNLNWLDTIERNDNLRFKPKAELRALLAQLGIEREQEIIVYCQTHHRSSHSFMMLRHLGFDSIRGYPGSWSEWGSDPALPVESLPPTPSL